MDGEQARMVFTDPPYNVKIDGHVGGSGRIKHREFAMASGEMSASEFTAFLRTSFRNLADACVDGAIVYICMDWRHMQEVLDAADGVFAELKNLIVWVKDNGGMGTFYRSRHELIFAFKVGTAAHVNSFELGQHGRYRTNVWQYRGVNTLKAGRMAELELHPTVKPVQMIADAIRDVSGRGEIVLDLFGGSGSTLIAAEKTGRRAFLCELDPVYCDRIIRRWEAWAKDEAEQLVCGYADGATAACGPRNEAGRATGVDRAHRAAAADQLRGRLRQAAGAFAFQKGQSGNPKGRPKGAKTKTYPAARRAAEGDHARGGLPDDRRPRRPARGQGADGAGDRPRAGGQRGQGPAAGAAALHRAPDHHRAGEAARAVRSARGLLDYKRNWDRELERRRSARHHRPRSDPASRPHQDRLPHRHLRDHGPMTKEEKAELEIWSATVRSSSWERKPRPPPRRGS